MPKPSQEPPASSKAPNKDLKEIWQMDVLKTLDYIQIKIKIGNPSQEPSASSKAPNQDLKDMDVLCTIKIKMESQI